MRKVTVRTNGGPEVLEVVSMEPPTVKHDELLVDVEAAGVNFIDVYQRTGSLDVPKPFTPGFEGVGVIRTVGDGITALKVGERVAWINALGSYAEQVVLPQAQAIRVPKSFTTEQALLFQAVSAQYLLEEYRSIQSGDVVLVHSAAGGVGQILTQWLKHLGAVVIGTASTEAKLRTIRALGADHAIDYASGDFLGAVFELTHGRGVDLALDAVGAQSFAASVKALAPRGTAISYGMASGVAPPIEIMPLILKGARVAGADLFLYIRDPAEMQRRAAAVIRGIEQGWLRFSTTTRFALDEVAAAHRALESRTTQGKLVLLPQEKGDRS
jgi:NADPH2:quinone reductase